MTLRHHLSVWVGLLCVALSAGTQAKLIEEIIKVPLKVTDSYGRVIAQDEVANLFYDSEDGPEISSRMV